jgi:surfactin synthase thioesterase subunit
MLAVDKASVRLGKRTGGKNQPVLFALPRAGTSVYAAYAAYAELVPEWVELFCSEPPGRERPSASDR